MEQNNLLYKEKIKGSVTLLLLPAFSVGLVLVFLKFYWPADFLGTKEIIALIICLIFALVFFLSLFNFKIAFDGRQLVFGSTFIKNKISVNSIEKLEIKTLSDAKKEYDLENPMQPEVLAMLFGPKRIFSRPKKVLVFEVKKKDLVHCLSTNNPEELFSLLIQYGAQKK